MTNAFTSSKLVGQMFQDRAVAHAFSDANVLHSMLAFERAWSVGLSELGSVAQGDGRLAVAVIDGFAAHLDAISAGSDRDGLPVPELIRQLRAGQPESVRAAIHTGATSQDVLDTAMMLICRDLGVDFAARAKAAVTLIDALDGQFGHVQMMGRTRMQAALPIAVSDRLRSWRAPLKGAIEQLESLPFRIQVGGPVGVRDAQGAAMVEHMARALNLQGGPVWHSDRSPVLDIGHALMLMCGALGKIGGDIALMAQQGVDEIALSGAGGSSAMPHKQNPVCAEALVTLARYVAGQQGILGQSLVHEQERSGAAWALEWMVLPAMFEATGAALNQANALLAQITRIGSTD